MFWRNTTPIRDRSPIFRAISLFLSSPIYIAAVAVITAIGYLFGLEWLTYSLYALLAVLTVFLAEDAAPLLVLTAFGYMTVSRGNNPGAAVEGGILSERLSVFYLPSFRVFLGIIAAILGICFAAKWLLDRKKRELRSRPALTVSLLVLGLTYMLGGLFSPYYSVKTVLFGLVQLLSICVPYFYFVTGPRPARRDLYGRLFTAVGILLLVESIHMYRYVDLSQAVERHDLFTGWGIANNVGGMAALCIPAPFCMITERKKFSAYAPISLAILIGVMLTQCRNAILFGSILFVVSILVTYYFADKALRRQILLFYAISAAVALLCSVLFWKELSLFFRSMLDNGADLNSRDSIWLIGLQYFREHPIFGNGFFHSGTFRWGQLSPDSFIPPRYHNTFVQLLASGGIVALVAYGYHRVETVRLLLKKRTPQTIYIALSVADLLLTSLLDCFFFNIGPGLSYGLLLVFLEWEQTESI